MQSVIKRFAFMTLFLSLLIHAATFFPAWAASLPLKPLMLMHVAVLAAFICTVIMINQRPIPPPSDPTPRPGANWAPGGVLHS
mgnify:CR=1 FL=1